LKVVVVVVEAELSGVRVGVVVIESVVDGGSVAVVVWVPGCSLAVIGSLGTDPFVDGEQAETSHIIAATTVNPHPIIRFLHLDISFTTFEYSCTLCRN
jgi:hypothetical protein